MSYDESYAAGGGGFVPSTYPSDADAYGEGGDASSAGGGEAVSSQGAAGAERKKRPAKDHTLLPVTIKMLLDASYAQQTQGGKYKGLTLNQVIIYACVMNQADRVSGMEYSLEDGTGIITAMQFTDESSSAAAAAMGVGEGEEIGDVRGRYVKVIGKVQTSSTPFGAGAPRLSVLHLHVLDPEVDDFNAITAHFLYTALIFLRTTGKPRPLPDVSSEYKSSYVSEPYSYPSSASSMAAAASSSFEREAGMQHPYAEGGGGREPWASQSSQRGGRGAGRNPITYQSPQAQMSGFAIQVSNAMSSMAGNFSEEGIALADIVAQFPQAGEEQIRQSLRMLADEGRIYTTIDDFHFKTCE